MYVRGVRRSCREIYEAAALEAAAVAVLLPLLLLPPPRKPFVKPFPSEQLENSKQTRIRDMAKNFPISSHLFLNILNTLDNIL